MRTASAAPGATPPTAGLSSRAGATDGIGLRTPVTDPGATAMRIHDTLGRDMVYRYHLGGRPRLEYVSRACVALTGYTPEEHYADPDLSMRIVHPDDMQLAKAAMSGRGPLTPIIVRLVRRDGSMVWTEQYSQILKDDQGAPAWLEGIVRDVSDAVLAREALRGTHAAARTLLDGSASLGVILDTAGRILHANQALLAMAGWTLGDVVGRPWSGLLGDPADPLPVAAASAGPLEERPRTTLLLHDGQRHSVCWSAMPLVDNHGATSATVALGEDLTEADLASDWSATLATVVAVSGESVVITDMEARIRYVNAAFERATGFSADEVLGENTRILASGHHAPAFYRAMWWMLGRGRPWRGELVNRRKDGTLLIEEASIVPAVGAAGTIVGYVAVKRDVTRQRQLRASLDDAHQQREVLAAALNGLVPRATAEETCDDLAAVLCEFPGAVAAAVALVDGGSIAHIVGFRSTMPLAVGRGFTLPAITERMVDHAEQGPWIEPLQLGDRPEADDAQESGLGAVLVVPVRHEGEVLGALLIAGPDASGADLQPQIPAAIQVSAVARSLLAPHLAVRLARERARERARRIVADRAFRTVFQPIVDLYSGGIVGFEALTRFDNRAGPEAEFAAAAACGMGEAMELATMEVAIVSAKTLPAAAALFLNVSPETLVTSDALPGMLRAIGRSVILEVTERTAIEDYDAIRAAIARIGPDTRIAVDDAGAGTTNLRHLFQLRPDFVKLDNSLVHGIDEDFTRQALVVGLKEFARVSGRAVIAEGVETELERLTLVELAIRFGQGYLLGAPAPAEAWSHVAIESPESFAADVASEAWSPATHTPAASR